MEGRTNRIIQSRDLFSASNEVKQECAINSAKSGKNHGYLGVRGETLDPVGRKVGRLPI